ncbi:MAG: phospho-N-acetylmuramoyl-pentapeptide-transferase [Candidatus Koribacter versatilis]|uniref:Phospho-N-acetylmuramoyl-pentapeptide-transferase n=1 Tax=Candidatus Korobacter versatilis TaxID=658062 RepID=A0A932A9Y9_9BACT|nr:phospho-N-acetylmuramoyl-pentapeptide-transferase [Candidatus Koribacter versatilis]
MLFWLLYEKIFHLDPFFSPFRIFRFLTFRTAFASLTALFMGLIIGPAVIRQLREFQIGQYIREEGPKAHQKKAGTPTMGGVLITISIVVPTILWADLSNKFVWLAVMATLAFGAIGFADDYLKIIHHRNLGLTGRTKLALQVLTSIVIAVILVLLQAKGEYSTHLIVPFFKNFRPDLALPGLEQHVYLVPLAFLPFIIFVAIVIVGSSNAVNLTDGLDGLAIGCTVIAAGALTVLTYVSGHAQFADYLELQRMPQVGELSIFCGAMVGASIGFLWYNAHPAEIFMGDVGSLALGGAIGTVAVIIKQELLLPFIGGIFVIEALSVILQVGSYKLRKKRIFKMAPLHHHFELLGWSESKIIVRFWIASLVFALFALTSLKLR